MTGDPVAAQSLDSVLDALWAAEHSARVEELHGNEGDADAIRRDAIRSILGLGIGERMYPTRQSQEAHRVK